MHAQTRPRFILSSEGVLGGMEFEPMLTPREKSPVRKMSPEEDRTRDAVDSEPKHYQLSYSGPLTHHVVVFFLHHIWEKVWVEASVTIKLQTLANLTYFTLLLSTAYTTCGIAGRKRRLSAARQNAWAGGMLYKDSDSLTPLIQVTSKSTVAIVTVAS